MPAFAAAAARLCLRALASAAHSACMNAHMDYANGCTAPSSLAWLGFLIACFIHQSMLPVAAGAIKAHKHAMHQQSVVHRLQSSTCCSAMKAAAAFQWSCVSATVACMVTSGEYSQCLRSEPANYWMPVAQCSQMATQRQRASSRACKFVWCSAWYKRRIGHRWCLVRVQCAAQLWWRNVRCTFSRSIASYQMLRRTSAPCCSPAQRCASSVSMLRQLVSTLLNSSVACAVLLPRSC